MPNDLQNITIKKSFMGYNEDVVNDVLDKIIEDYSAYIHENIELKDRMAVLNEGMQHYKTIEESLQNTLMAAQQTGEDIRKNAYQKAENIIKEAELKAQKITNDASQDVARITYEFEEVKRRFSIFKSKSETLLLTQLELIKQINEEVD